MTTWKVGSVRPLEDPIRVLVAKRDLYAHAQHSRKLIMIMIKLTDHLFCVFCVCMHVGP